MRLILLLFGQKMLLAGVCALLPSSMCFNCIYVQQPITYVYTVCGLLNLSDLDCGPMTSMICSDFVDGYVCHANFAESVVQSGGPIAAVRAQHPK